MKQAVINVVSFFVWLSLVASIIIGYALAGVPGAILGVIIGCFTCGLWFLLSQINDRLGVLAEEAMKQGEIRTLGRIEDSVDLIAKEIKKATQVPA